MRMTRKRAVEPEAGEVEQYAGAFARVRLVRAWIAAAAAMVGMLYAFVALLERVVKQLPDFTQAHVVLARLYFKLKRPQDAENERLIINRLNAEQQKKEPTGKPEAQPANPR